MAKRNTKRGDYYREKAREEEAEFFDAPEAYRTSVRNSQEEKPAKERGGAAKGGKIFTIILVGIVSILAVLLAAYYLLLNQGKVPEVGPLTTTTVATTQSISELEDGTLPGEGANIVINGTTVGNTSNSGGSDARKTTVTVKSNAYVTDKMTSSDVSAMVKRAASSKGNVLIWDNIIEDDSDLTQYNFTYADAYYRVTSEDEDIIAIQKNTVYIFLTATNKDPEQEEKGMLVLRAENAYMDDGKLNAEYIEGEMDSYDNASSFISSYMANKSGFTKVS